MRFTDDGGFGDGRVFREHALDLGGGHQVTGDVQHVVDTAGDPEIAVLIPSGSCEEIMIFNRLAYIISVFIEGNKKDFFLFNFIA